MNIFSPSYARISRASALAIATGAILIASNIAAAQTEHYVSTDLTFRDGSLHTHKVIDLNGIAIAEGDMILGASADFFNNNKRRHTRGLSNTSYGQIWPNGVVPYRISNALSNTTENRIRDAIEHWNSFQAITLVERTQLNASAYPDFIDFVKDDRCASWIGYQNNGAQSIYTGENCSTGTMIHEIGHALGLLHEHTRSDRDQYVDIHWDRIDEEMHINFEIMEGSILLGKYDYASIMHYGQYFFSNNGKPTIEPLQSTNASLGQRIETSPGDRAAVAELYKSNNSVTAVSTNNTTVGSDVEVTFLISNNTTVGSHDLNLDVQVPADSRLLSYSSANWICSQPATGNNVTCATPVLSANTQSKVSLNLLAANTPGTILLDAQLTSGTPDSDLSDNKDSTLINVVSGSNVTQSLASNKQNNNDLQFASALGQPSAGGGSLSTREIALLALLLSTMNWCRRRLVRQPVNP